MWPDSILLLFLVGVGGIAFGAAVVILVIGLLARSKDTRTIGWLLLGVSVVAWGVLLIWLGLVVPAFSRREATAWSGVYCREYGGVSVLESRVLALYGDFTCRLDADTGLGHAGVCRWTPDGIDGKLGLFGPREGDLWSSADRRERGGSRRLEFRGIDGSSVVFVRIGEVPAEGYPSKQR